MQLDGEIVGPNPTVSNIAPAYNAAGFLEDAVLSALAQTYDDFELLIVDRGSTDETCSVAVRLAALDVRLHALTTDHVGFGAPRNTAIAGH